MVRLHSKSENIYCHNSQYYRTSKGGKRGHEPDRIFSCRRRLDRASTTAGLKEALHLGGVSASRAIGVMTATFGAGQIAGPLMVSLLAGVNHAFALASLIAVVALVAGNCVLLAFDRPKVS